MKQYSESTPELRPAPTPLTTGGSRLSPWRGRPRSVNLFDVVVAVKRPQGRNPAQPQKAAAKRPPELAPRGGVGPTPDQTSPPARPHSDDRSEDPPPDPPQGGPPESLPHGCGRRSGSADAAVGNGGEPCYGDEGLQPAILVTMRQDPKVETHPIERRADLLRRRHPITEGARRTYWRAH